MMKLSMLKLSMSTLLLSSILSANIDTKIEDFLEGNFKNNPNVIDLEVKVVDKTKLSEPRGWSSFIIDVDATVKVRSKKQHIKQKMIWFSDGKYLSKDLISLDSGASLADSVAPKFKNEYYKDENLIYGNKDAKHKVAIFSDPLCPYCINFVPGAIEYMKKYPDKFAIYYYHFPLENIHPAATTLTKAAVVAQLQGYKDVTLKLYKVKVRPRERNIEKILSAFNKTFGLNIKKSDLETSKVKQHIKSDLDIANSVMVQGTPTIFFDGELDKTRSKYKKVK